MKQSKILLGYSSKYSEFISLLFITLYNWKNTCFKDLRKVFLYIYTHILYIYICIKVIKFRIHIIFRILMTATFNVLLVDINSITEAALYNGFKDHRWKPNCLGWSTKFSIVNCAICVSH